MKKSTIIVVILVVLTGLLLLLWNSLENTSPSKVTAVDGTADQNKKRTAHITTDTGSQEPGAVYLEQLKRLLSLPEGEQRRQAFREFMAGIPASLYPEVAELLRQVPHDRRIDDELTILGQFWGRHDGPAAIAFMTSLYPRDNGMINPGQATIKSWANTDPDATAAFLREMPTELRGWKGILTQGAYQVFVDMDVTYAMQMADQESGFRYLAMDTIATHAAPEQHGNVANWLAKHGQNSPLEIFDATEHFLHEYAVNKPVDAINWVLDSLPPGELRMSALIRAVQKAGANSPQGVSELLNAPDFFKRLFPEAANSASVALKQKFHQKLLAEFLKSTSLSTTPEFALANLHVITDPALRDSVKFEYYYNVERGNLANVWDNADTIDTWEDRLWAREYNENETAATDAASANNAADAELEALLDPQKPNTNFDLMYSQDGHTFSKVNQAMTNENDFFYTIVSNEPITIRLKNIDRPAESAFVYPVYSPFSVSNDGDYIVATIKPRERMEIEFGAGRNAIIQLVPESE